MQEGLNIERKVTPEANSYSSYFFIKCRNDR
jgi:hypothetical protein